MMHLGGRGVQCHNQLMAPGFCYLKYVSFAPNQASCLIDSVPDLRGVWCELNGSKIPQAGQRQPK